MRPTIKFLSKDSIKKIIDEALNLLWYIGLEIHNENVKQLLLGEGAIEKENRIFIHYSIVEDALKKVPKSFCLYDRDGDKTHEFKNNNVYFTPGSTAINILDYNTKIARPPLIEDYENYVKIIDQLPYIQSQSTALVPSEVPREISDSIRLFLSILYSKKPIITGAFTINSFEVMKNLQLAVRTTEEDLKQKPLTIFSICPTSPLKWSQTTSQNLLDCAKYCIPVEFIAMPLSGLVSPATLYGTLIQHTAETISGIIIGQLANPGTPMLYGGSPAIFDMRYETTPMGAIETMMIDCAYNEIGKYLNIPTQAYISFSDSKQLDAQAGLESGGGAFLASLAGINNISGPGMLDFESCQSLEKLIIDNEICGMCFRLIQGINTQEETNFVELFQELITEKHLLISDHTISHIKKEHFIPGLSIDRKNLKRWEKDGSESLEKRAHSEVLKMIKNYKKEISSELEQDLLNIMNQESLKYNYILKIEN